MSRIASTPKPPYYAVIFVSERTEGERVYEAIAEQMVELAVQVPGFLGVESVRGADGFEITVSYWESEEAIRNWKENAQHKLTQDRGKTEWYLRYKTRVCRVERDYHIT